ncbi:hypothetical protein DB347_24765 [Opitutaceae bacterium EW11]|nr:hypothetical protein DB347_24765 [Opitutaceae bacterium EW11]
MDHASIVHSRAAAGGQAAYPERRASTAGFSGYQSVTRIVLVRNASACCAPSRLKENRVSAG